MQGLTTEQRGSVLVLRFAREPGNFLTHSLVAELLRVVSAAERDSSVRAVVLSSDVPGIFIGHYDSQDLLDGSRQAGTPLSPGLAGLAVRVVSALGRVPGLGGLLDRGPAGGLRALIRFRDVVRVIRASGKLYVAAISGYALGGGFELALACDLRIIGDGDYGIGLPEIAFGLIPAGGGTQMLTRLLGTGPAIAALLEGRLFSPQEAYQVGLVHRQARQEELLAAAVAAADQLSRHGDGVVRAAKRVVYEGGSGRLERGLAQERNEFLGLATRGPAQATVQRYATLLRDRLDQGGRPADFFREYLPDWQDHPSQALDHAAVGEEVSPGEVS